MGRFRQKVMQFMQGRYGADQFSRFLIYLSLILLVITLFCRNNFIYYIAAEMTLNFKNDTK